MNINPFDDAPWFSIDENQYLVYLLKGYEIALSDNKKCVYFLEDGKYHREDGPAVIWSSGSVEYWQNGLRHREDGPAIIWSSGTVQYFQNDKLHREDGPAIIYKDGSEFYYLNGYRLSHIYSPEQLKEYLEKGDENVE